MSRRRAHGLQRRRLRKCLGKAESAPARCPGRASHSSGPTGGTRRLQERSANAATLAQPDHRRPEPLAADVRPRPRPPATGPAAATSERASGCRLLAASDGGNPQRLGIDSVLQRPASRLGQRAGLVEHDRVDVGQPLQRRRPISAARRARNSRAVAITCTAGTASASAQGQVMISTALAVSSACLPGTPATKIPAQEGQQRRHDAPPARSGAPPGRRARRSANGALPPPRSAARIRPAACRRRSAVARTRSGAPRFSVPANTGVPVRALHRQALAGDQAGVERRRAALHDAVDADPLAERRPACGRQAPRCAGCARAVLPSGCSTATSDAAQRQQLLGRRASLAAGAMVEHAADQQEEQQRDGGVEIGVRAALRCVCARLMPVTRITPTLIGTSMLVRPWRSAATAERKNGRPA